MAYTLSQFIADCRSSLTHDPGPHGREEVRVNLERLLNNKDFVEEYCGDKVERGLKVLYEDPALKFQILAHINDKARASPPHDHGESWAIYGQATLWTDMKYTHHLEVTNGDVVVATVFARRLDLSLRAPDALHLAIARRVGARLLTFDKAMAVAARSLGITVLSA